MKEFIKKSGAKLVILNEGMKDITKIVHYLESSNILMKGVTKLIQNKTKEKKVDFLVYLG